MFDRGMTSTGFDRCDAVRNDAATLLSAMDLGVRMSGKKLLDIPFLQIAAGEPTAIMGPNGAGKSLLLRLLHGLSQPSLGTIRMHGEPLNTKLCRRQAMVFQSPIILRRSVYANVEFALASHKVPRRLRKERVHQFLVRAGLANKWRQSARSLSGGEQQKLAVVRALATEPEILFLDEPTSNLDPGSVQSIETLLQEASATGTKIVLVTHDLSQAQRLGHEVMFLHQGRITEQTPIRRFASSPASPEAARYLAGELLV